MKEKIKKVIVALCFIVTILTIPVTEINAQNPTLNLQSSGTVYWDQNGVFVNVPSVNSNEEVPYNSKLLLEMNVSNHGGSISSYINFYTKQGIALNPYYEGVLIIDGVNASHQQYQEFIGNGLLRTLTTQNTIIQLEVTSIGSQWNRISGDMKVYSPSVQGINSEHCEYAFYGRFSSIMMHTVNFYGVQNELLSSQQVADGSEAVIPNFANQGYEFFGFNTSKDGSGNYYSGEIVKASINLYPIVEVKTFTVNYYVDQKLFYSSKVNFGSDVKAIKAPDKEKDKFVEWRGRLKNIQSDTNIYALYESEVGTSNPFISIRESRKKEGSSELEIEKDHMISYMKPTKKKEEKIKTTYKKQIVVETNVLGKSLLIIALFGFLVTAILYKKRKK